jgi:four helix bundle protein
MSRGVRESGRVERVQESEESGRVRRVGRHTSCPIQCMRADKLEDLLVYTKALEGIDAVSPLLMRPKLIRDYDLHKQLSESTGKIPGHIGEGFGQGTDRHFAHYLVIARGSALETRGHLATARKRKYISREEEIPVSGLYQDLADMLKGFIAYLRRSDRKDRW